MFLNFVLRYFLGFVKFEGRGVYIENFISQCAKEKINVWAIKRQNEYFTGYILANAYKKLKYPAKKNGIRIRVIKKVGLVFLINRHYKRIGIYIGGAIFILTLTILSNFVWAFDVVGNNNVSEDEILKALGDFGLSYGSYIPSLDVRKLEQQMLLKFDSLSWIGININSSRAQIQVHETVFVPEEKRNDDGLYNIVASDDGQIKKMQVYSGQEVVNIGDSVKKGDLIISGIVEDKKGNTLLRHARAKVIALVPFEKTFEVNLEESYEVDTLNTKVSYSLYLFGKEFSFKKKIKFENYNISKSQIYPSVFGFSLPFYIEKTVFSEYTTQTQTLSYEQARKKAFSLYNDFVESSNAEISKEYISEKTENGVYILSVEGSFKKDIAEERWVQTE